MWYIIAVVVIAGLFIGQWLRIIWFRRHAGMGDSCVFYVNSDRYQGEIVGSDGDSVVIINAFGTYARVRSEIYPI